MKNQFTLFDTAIGTCAISWRGKEITSMRLPEADETENKTVLYLRFRDSTEAKPNRYVKDVIKRITEHLDGHISDFKNVRLCMNDISPFSKRVYESLRNVQAGIIITYGELAGMAGSPKACRAVGRALATNPFAVLVPCHRVIASGNKIGGFSAFGRLDLKLRLLKLEGIDLKNRGQTKKTEKLPFGILFNPDEAVNTLIKADKQLGNLIKRVGDFKLSVESINSPFDALLEAIVYQQLTGKAAATIFARVKSLFNHDGQIRPFDILRASDEELRGAGLSRAKIAAARDLAEKALDGTLPSFVALKKMTDEEIIDRLTTIRGIGRWTVEMLLIFRLGRPDVFPANDYGIRKGFAATFHQNRLPTPKEISKYGERWKPFRTVASWYLWRAADNL